MAVYRVDVPGNLATTEGFQFGFHCQGTASDAGAAAAADAWLTAFLAGASDIWKPAISFGPCRVTQVAASPGMPAISQALGAVTDVGTGSGSSLPPQVALVVSLRTALAGRAFRGRFYLPAPSTVQLTDDGRVSTACLASLAIGVNDAFDALEAAGYIPCIAHRAAGTTTVVTSADAGDVFDTQRRRRNGTSELRSALWP